MLPETNQRTKIYKKKIKQERQGVSNILFNHFEIFSAILPEIICLMEQMCSNSCSATIA